MVDNYTNSLFYRLTISNYFPEHHSKGPPTYIHRGSVWVGIIVININIIMHASDNTLTHEKQKQKLER